MAFSWRKISRSRPIDLNDRPADKSALGRRVVCSKGRNHVTAGTPGASQQLVRAIIPKAVARCAAVTGIRRGPPAESGRWARIQVRIDCSSRFTLTEPDLGSEGSRDEEERRKRAFRMGALPIRLADGAAKPGRMRGRWDPRIPTPLLPARFPVRDLTQPFFSPDPVSRDYRKHDASRPAR